MHSLVTPACCFRCGWAHTGGFYARQSVLFVAFTSPGNAEPTLDLLSLNVYLNKMLKDLSVI